ncbi:ATP-binding protein [Streptomyces sp. NPDC001450]
MSIRERSVAVASADGARLLTETAGQRGAQPGRAVPRMVMSIASESSLVPAVRHSVRATAAIRGSSELAGQLELLASELVSNAVRYGGGGGVTVLLTIQGGVALLEVEDRSDAEPVVCPVGEDDEGGRGLALVAVLADAWGWRPAGRGGKRVWVRVLEPCCPAAFTKGTPEGCWHQRG